MILQGWNITLLVDIVAFQNLPDKKVLEVKRWI
jgi:hypothetical protein